MSLFKRNPTETASVAIRETYADIQKLKRQLVTASRETYAQSRKLRETSTRTGIDSGATRHEAALLATLESNMMDIQALIARHMRMVSVLRGTAAATTANITAKTAAVAIHRIKSAAKIDSKKLDALTRACDETGDVLNGDITAKIVEEVTAMQQKMMQDDSATDHTAVDAIIERLKTQKLSEMPMPPPMPPIETDYMYYNTPKEQEEEQGHI